METTTFVANLTEALKPLLLLETNSPPPKMTTRNGVTTINFSDGGKLTFITTPPIDLTMKHAAQSSFTGC